jgi:DNA-binding response OmpR family regulator
VFEVGGLRIDLNTDEVTREEEPVKLTDLEYKLLAYLLRRRGRTATREQILRDVWDLPSEVETRTIDRHVNALRDVMDGESEDEWAIQSVYGIGYKLEGADRLEPAKTA